MSSAASITNATRSALEMLVNTEETRVGSRDVALKNIAQLVGSSASWVSKFVGCSPEVKEPRMTLFMNIRSAYEEFCNRVEQAQRAELAKITLLKKEIDAATHGFVELVQDNARPATSRKGGRRR